MKLVLCLTLETALFRYFRFLVSCSWAPPIPNFYLFRKSIIGFKSLEFLFLLHLHSLGDPNPSHASKCYLYVATPEFTPQPPTYSIIYSAYFHQQAWESNCTILIEDNIWLISFLPWKWDDSPLFSLSFILSLTLFCFLQTLLLTYLLIVRLSDRIMCLRSRLLLGTTL